MVRIRNGCAQTADGAIAVAGLRRTAASNAASRPYLPWVRITSAARARDERAWRWSWLSPAARCNWSSPSRRPSRPACSTSPAPGMTAGSSGLRPAIGPVPARAAA